MMAVPRAQRLPKATETKAEPDSMPFLGHVQVEPIGGGGGAHLAGVWTKGCKIMAATQGDSCKLDTSGTLANLAFQGVAAAVSKT